MYKLKYLKQNYSFTPLIKFLTLGVILAFVSCAPSQKEDYHTYFGGKIKNPKDDLVYFLKDEKIIDSAKIDSHNRFQFKLDSIENGLYVFKHGPEFQYLYLEPQDSLLIYLNTWDFDESLIFSGRGSKKNNYLINLYLTQERVEKDFIQNYKLNEAEFSKLIDAQIKKQLDDYQRFIAKEQNSPSPFFEKLVMASIYYPNYYKKEYYPFYHRKMMHLKEFPYLSKSFYDYRKSIDLNDASLLSFGPYASYLNLYLRNRAHVMKLKNPSKSNVDLNFMEVVNEKIKIKSEKNKLLARAAWSALVYDNLSQSERDTILNYFFANCSDEKITKEIKTSIAQREKIKVGNNLPQIMATNIGGNDIAINSIAQNSPAVIYFWPTDLGKIELMTEKLNHLQKSYPNIVFIGIDRNKSDKDWKQFITNKKLSAKTQYKLNKNTEHYSWFAGNSDRTIIVDENGIGVGHIQSTFHNGGGNQHIKLPVHKGQH